MFCVLEGLMDDEGVATTETVMELEVDVAGLAQILLLVSTQVTASLFCKDVVVKVALFVPALLPLTFHW